MLGGSFDFQVGVERYCPVLVGQRFDCGAEDGDIGEKSKSALSFFAASVCEEPSPDALDESMRLSLVEKHRS